MLSLALTLPFVIFISSLSMACGFILTALFTECDPMKAGIINDQNQYLPYLGKLVRNQWMSLNLNLLLKVHKHTITIDIVSRAVHISVQGPWRYYST